MEGAQEMMKRQFDKKRQNLQGLQEREDMWLEAINIYLNRSSKKLDVMRRFGHGQFLFSFSFIF